MDNRKHIKWCEPTITEIRTQNEQMKIILSILFNQVILSSQGVYKVVEYQIKYDEDSELYIIWLKGRHYITNEIKFLQCTLNKTNYKYFSEKEHPWQER